MQTKRKYSGQSVSREWLKEFFDYVPSTGEFFWKKPCGKKIKVGQKAGSIGSNGYFYLCAEGQVVLSHRAAWLYVYGEMPKDNLDHINGDPKDNRIENLRPANVSQNSCNGKLRSTNKSGYRGVSWNKEKRKWQARIVKDRKTHCLGYFDDIEQARMAYLEAANKLHGEFARPDG